jgi:co-chaperonin GroES (HSP10)
MIQPLGNQIIIRTLPPESWKGIIIPDTSRGSTIVGAKGAEDAAHFVEAEVIAVGPGTRRKGDPDVVDALADLVEAIRERMIRDEVPHPTATDALNQQYKLFGDLFDMLNAKCDDAHLLERARNRTGFLELSVKPGDRVLYHPAVKSFDREIDGHHIGLGDGDYYICGEHSILAVIEE